MSPWFYKHQQAQQWWSCVWSSEWCFIFVRNQISYSTRLRPHFHQTGPPVCLLFKILFLLISFVNFIKRAPSFKNVASDKFDQYCCWMVKTSNIAAAPAALGCRLSGNGAGWSPCRTCTQGLLVSTNMTSTTDYDYNCKVIVSVHHGRVKDNCQNPKVLLNRTCNFWEFDTWSWQAFT